MSLIPDKRVPVLDYAPTPSLRPLKERIAPVALIVICAVLGAFIQNRFQPRFYTSVGYLSVSPASTKAAPSVHARALTAFAPSILPKLPPTAGGRLTAADLTATLKVYVVPGSPVVMVAYMSDNPAQTATVANTLMNAYIAKTSGVVIVAPAPIPTAPQPPNLLYFLAGAIAGASIGLILPFVKKRQDAHRRAALKIEI